MVRKAKGVRVRRESVDEAVTRLRTHLERYEARYECRSDFMVQAIECGHMKETAEIGRWLSSYQALQALLETQAGGRTTGTRTKATKLSI
jgi:hypothetical protein